MPSGAISLANYPSDVVMLACERCGRRGEYSKARLVAEHGPEIGLPDLRVLLAADCSLIHNKVGNDTCAAVFPELIKKSLAQMLIDAGCTELEGGGVVITGAARPPRA